MKKVSVIILNYNAGKFLIESVKRVLAQTIPIECIIVDNASKDGSLELLQQRFSEEPRITIHKNPGNYGFSKGCNAGLPYASSDFILFLNPDCFIEPDTLAKLIDELEKHPDAGLMSCLIRNMDGSEQRGCRRNFPTPWTALMRVFWFYKYFKNSQYLKGFDLTDTALPQDTIDIDGISGALMLVRRTALEEVGPLDEGYRLHCEDLDWCMRFHQKNWRVLFVPFIEVKHIKGACSQKNPSFVIWHKHKGMWRFYKKNYKDQYPKLIFMLVWVAVFSRCLLNLAFKNIAFGCSWLKQNIKKYTRYVLLRYERPLKKIYHKMPFIKKINFLKPFISRLLKGGLETKLGGEWALQTPSLHHPDVFIWAVIDWDFRFQRPQQLATQFAQQGQRVFYFSNNLLVDAVPGFKVKQLDDQGRLFSVYLQVSHPVTIYQDAPSKVILADLKASMKIFYQWAGTKQAYSFVHHPFWYNLVKQLPNQRLTYDCMDHHAGFDNNAKVILELEEKLTKNADLVFVSSKKLYEEIIKLNSNIALVRNGCDDAYFSTPPASIFTSPQVKNTIGYYGAIAEWFDIELIEKIAIQFPESLILLVGNDTIGLKKKLAAYSNVLMTGEVKYQDLTYYLYAMDVCLIPFKINALTLATNPVKAYEYLSAGKPIVAVDLPELQGFENNVFIAQDHQHFIKLVQDVLKEEENKGQIHQRQVFAKTQTWAERACAMKSAIEKQAYPKVSIIIVTYNNLEFTKACLSSLEQHTLYSHFEVIIVDNASVDETPSYLSEYCRERKNYTALLNTDNLGFAAANNQALQKSTGDYLILLNNDTYVTPGWVGTLLRHFKEHPNLGILGPLTNNTGNEAKVRIAYHEIIEMLNKVKDFTFTEMGRSFSISCLAFFCVMFPREIYEKVGDLDESFGIGMFEDDDYCQRIKALGYEIRCAEDVFIHHHMSASFDQLGYERKQALFDKNKIIYEKKWGKWEPHQRRAVDRKVVI